MDKTRAFATKSTRCTGRCYEGQSQQGPGPVVDQGRAVLVTPRVATVLIGSGV